MNNRIDTTFQKLRENDEAAFVAYVCAGDPGYKASLDIVKSLADAGADIIELGVPFSDPQADGVVNQLAAERALKAGMSAPKLMERIKEFRTTPDTAIVLFPNLNPVLPTATNNSIQMPRQQELMASCYWTSHLMK